VIKLFLLSPPLEMNMSSDKYGLAGGTLSRISSYGSSCFYSRMNFIFMIFVWSVRGLIPRIAADSVNYVSVRLSGSLR